MLQVIQTLLGFAFTVSVIALIKPTIFNKKLRRKHVLIALAAIIVLIVVVPTDPNVALREQQATEQKQAEAEVQKVAEAEERVLNIERLDLLGKISLTPSIRNNSIGIPELYLTIKNNTEKTLDGIEISANFENNFGDTYYDAFGGRSQETIYPGGSKTVNWMLTSYQAATKTRYVIPTRIHFSDGTEVNWYEMKPPVNYTVEFELGDTSADFSQGIVIFPEDATEENLEALGSYLNLKYAPNGVVWIAVFTDKEMAEFMKKYSDGSLSEETKAAYEKAWVGLYSKVGETNQFVVHRGGYGSETIETNY